MYPDDLENQRVDDAGASECVCSGGRPMAATNCLNFGNPEHPEVMWQFSEAVDGMSEACSFFGTPITGGNVSFYNETFGGDIYPTPVLGMVPFDEMVMTPPGCPRVIPPVDLSAKVPLVTDHA